MDIKELVSITKNLKLLYIEDDEEARFSSLNMLKNFFSDIDVAADGFEGLEKFKSKQFDIVLSDINMPKLNGIEVLKEIRAYDEDIPVIFLSAYNETSYLLDGIKLGVDGYILKPFELEFFLQVLKKIVYKIQLKKQSENYKENLEREVKRRTLELDRKLSFDELTGLSSRYSFFEDIKNVKIPILLVIDINNFRTINEIYGTTTGSLVLKKFANFLLSFSQNSTYGVYRLSGDEFALFDDVHSINPEKYERDILRLFTQLKNFKVELENDSITIEITIGVSTSQNDVFESAKLALDYAKKNKKHYTTYSKAIDKRQEERDALVWKDKIKYAIENSLVTPVYHAIVSKDGTILKYEALMRLKDKDTNALITPFYFLNIAIKTGLYASLSSHVIFESLRLIDTSSKTISMNFTYQDVKNSSFINEIDSFFRLSPEAGKRAVFEITETQSIENYDDIKEFIKRFRKYGVRFAIDDFGSGFSNFEYILEIEPDYLKIDGSLIKDIDTDEKAYILVKAIVQFSHELGIKVIAEYVHSKIIFDMLKVLNVDEYQGFYFYEPVESEE